MQPPPPPRAQECLRTFTRHTEAVVAIAWLPSGNAFVSAGADRQICIWGDGGEVLHAWHGTRVTDLAVHHASSQLIASSQRGIHMCPMPTLRPMPTIPTATPTSHTTIFPDLPTSQSGDVRSSIGEAEWPSAPFPSALWAATDKPLTSLNLSRDTCHALVNTASDEVHLFDLQSQGLRKRYACAQRLSNA